MGEQAPANFIARLLAERHIPRADALAQRALVDEGFRLEVERRLEACGLRLLDNPFAGHLAVALSATTESAAFGNGDQWLSNNLGLQRDGVALLVLLWALIILPKRERQLSRDTGDTEGQGDMFGAAKPTPKAADASRGIPENLLLDDYGKQLGGKTRVNMNLGILSRVGFIERRNKVIQEGPLLDLAFDYAQLAPRIIQGALGELLMTKRDATNREGEA
ncbi:MAG: hypothetical protein PHG47_06825 [Sulfuricella sp.]|nr:hypothetical protein [Sulfuricella sp.]